MPAPGHRAGGTLHSLEDRALSFSQAVHCCVRPTRIGEALCFPQSADLHVHLSKNAFTDTPRIMFDQVSGHL